ncbi:unannotated protein [freshwater metagenome]|uniref:Unannotated protein n=1 Tax=freshwater metagenome TaxID=449393 RepID=A0A6J7RWQ3_9ZZZZ
MAARELRDGAAGGKDAVIDGDVSVKILTGHSAFLRIGIRDSAVFTWAWSNRRPVSWRGRRSLPASERETTVDYNWMRPGAEARPVGAKGWGSFATELIPAGATVAGFGGWVVPRDVLSTFSSDRQARSLQVDEDLYLVSDETPEPADMFNHSCEPTCGLLGATVLVARRDIEVGEELTFDYATCDSSDYDEFPCLCGESTCRGVVTGLDWMKPELQAKYDGWFSPYLARRIASLPAVH